MRNRRGFGAAMTLLMTGLALGGVPLDFIGEVRTPTIPTEEEKEWMSGLNAYRQKEWKRRFERGLTKEQRHYINEQLTQS